MKAALVLAAVVALCTAGVPQQQPLPPVLAQLRDMPREEAVATLKEALRPQLQAAIQSALVGEGPSARGLIDDAIVSVLESLREVMRTGNPEKGIPVLDPFVYNHLDVELHEKLIDFTGNLDNFVMEGLSDYIIDQIKWSTLLMTFTFGFTMPKVTVKGEYGADSVLAGLLPVYGEGPFEVEIENLAVSGKAKLGLRNLFVYIRSVDLKISLGGYHSQIDGLLGGGDLSDLLNEVINDLVPEIIDANVDLAADVISDLIVTVGNQVLDGMTMSDIVNIITGGGKL